LRRCDLSFADVVATADHTANADTNFVPVGRAHFSSVSCALFFSIGGALRLPYSVACGIGGVAHTASWPYLRAIGNK